MKKGISLIVLAITIIVMLILASTIVTISVSAINDSKKVAFANDLATIQSAVMEYYNTNGVLPTKGNDITSVQLTESFQLINSPKSLALLEVLEEKHDDNTTFREIDLAKIGITSTARGTLKDGNNADIYVVNAKGDNVYYVQGVVINNEAYFALSNNLVSTTAVEMPTITEEYVEIGSNVDAITLRKNTKLWSNSIDINISTSVITGDKVVVTVGDVEEEILASATSDTVYVETYTLDATKYASFSSAQQTAFDTNKTITVTKTSSGVTSSSSIKADNFDIVAPSGTAVYSVVPSAEYNVITISGITDALSQIKEIRYEYIQKYLAVSSYENYYDPQPTVNATYLTTSGKRAVNGIKLPKNVRQISYVIIDNAGNATSVETYAIDDANLKVVTTTPSGGGGEGGGGGGGDIPPQTDWTNVATSNNTYDLTGVGYSYQNPVIPKGFKPVETNDASWESMEWNNGLVIEDAEANQFVWVPIDGTNVAYQKYYIGASHVDTLPNGVDEETSQISTYGGFYISRFEAGIPTTMTDALTNANTQYRDVIGTPLSKQNQSPWNYISYVNAKASAERMYSTSAYGAKSGIPTGTMWDVVCKWINNIKGITYSLNYGNYYDAPVTNVTSYSTNNGASWFVCSSSTKSTSTWWLLQTGHSDYTKVKNIYDIAGNLREYNANSKNRSSAYTAFGSSSLNEIIIDSGNMATDNIGFRMVLYIVPTDWATVATTNTTYDKTGSNYAYNNPVIPKGFRPVETSDASWENMEWNNGLVIEDASKNQFVWIPVKDGIQLPQFTTAQASTYSNNYSLVKYAKWCISGDSFADMEGDELPDSVASETAQITAYQGFYIARFEAGIPTTMTTALNNASAVYRDVADTPLSKRNQIPWNYISYVNAKTSAERMYFEDEYGVKSGLMTGTMWDTVCKWLQNSGCSSTWGNYYDVTISGITGYSSNYGSSWTSASSKPSGYSYLLKTGNSNDTKSKNIYDISGNLQEFTSENYNDANKVSRGGRYNSDAYYLLTRLVYGISFIEYSTGFRVALYVTTP